MVKKPSEGGSAEEKAKAENTWKQAKERVLEKKEAFEAVVQELSEDIAYKDKGGDMGWSTMDDIDQNMAKVVGEMKLGEVKEYASNFADFLLKLEEVQEAKVQTLDDVKLDIARKLMSEQEATGRVKTMADSLLAAAQKEPTKPLEEVLKAVKPAPPAPTPTPTPTPEDPAAPGDAPKDPAAPGDAPKDPAPGDAPPAEEKAAPETPWDKLQVATTGKFSQTPRQSYKFDPESKQIKPTSLPWNDIPRIGADKELAVASFRALTAEKPVYEKVLDKEGALFVVRLKERAEPKAEEQEKNLARSQEMLEGELSGTFLGGWRTLIYQPDAELKDVSPWLHQVFDEAQKSGKVKLDLTAFDVAAPAAPAEATPADGAAPAGAAPATPAPAVPASPNKP
jgi:hypothetical protein